MNFVHEIADQARRVAVDLLNGGGIERDAPWSPDVPEGLRQDMPDLFDRFPIVFPWEKPSPVDPALHIVWLLDSTFLPASHRVLLTMRYRHCLQETAPRLGSGICRSILHQEQRQRYQQGRGPDCRQTGHQLR